MTKIEAILQNARAAGASDIHLTVGIPPKMRVSGRLLTMNAPELTPEDTEEILNSIIPERSREMYRTQGECDFSITLPDCGRYRVNAYRQRSCAAMALRYVKTQLPSAEELRIPQTVLDLYQCQRGLVLVTGPTGSGKSTTMAAILDRINRSRNAHIITLEDPIEFLYQHDKAIVNQREIGTDSESFAAALRAALREDPDVIFVGEMRDLETISVAITAAETGHLVFSTLHTMSAADTVDRIIDVFPPHQQEQIRVQLASVLTAVISQQLIPMSRQRGRVAAFEVMLTNNAVRNLIREGKTHQIANVIQTNRQSGMITMDEAVSQLYRAGEISRDSAMQCARNPDMLKL